MPKSSTAKKRGKSAGRSYPKPYDGFPLSAHVHTGRWYKTIKERRYYCGPLDDWEQALKVYEHSAPYWAAGQTPPPLGDSASVKSVSHVVNGFLSAKRRRVESGEMTERTWAEYHNVGEMIVKAFGRHRDVDTLTPDDFGKLRASMAKGRSPVTLANLVTRARSIFKHAVTSRITDRAMHYGDQFAKPERRTIRLDRRSKPRKFFEAQEVRQLLDAADANLRAMILLAANAGLGNSDLSNLEQGALDLDAGTMQFHRSKTGIDRRATLWPQTVAALREVIDTRPAPADPDFGERVFLTFRGLPFVRTKVNQEATPDGRVKPRVSRTDGIAQQFNKLLKAAGVKHGGRGFYSLRHSFRTVADAVPDRPAVDVVMGHENEGDMRNEYVDAISVGDDRLGLSALHSSSVVGP